MAWIRFRNLIARMCNGASMFNSSCCGRRKIVINITEDHINFEQLNEIIQNFVSLIEIGDEKQALLNISNGLLKLRRDCQIEEPLIY